MELFTKTKTFGRWLSVADAALYTSFKEPTIRAALKAGTLTPYPVSLTGTGTRPAIRIDRHQLDKLIQSQTHNNNQPS